MTNKKEKILLAALELFAKEGFSATSTNKIAKKAGVSEGLIFRHFCNKKGLLQAIIKNGEERIKTVFADIIFETDPGKLIHKAIDLSMSIANDKDEAEFWKLQYKIKWELEQYGEHKMEPLEHALIKAFAELDYHNPEMEARLLLVNLDGLATRFFLQKQFDLQAMIHFLHLKYTT